MHTVVVLALPDAIAFDVATPVEVFGRARLPDGRPAYRVEVCATEPVVAAGPLRLVAAHGLEALADADTVVVPGRADPTAATPDAVVAALRAAAAAGTRIASICVGAFTLAAAGLLDGRRATTHWAAAGLFAAAHPAVHLDPAVLYVDTGQIVTSAGATAGVDMCLHLIGRDHGAAVAAHASRSAVAPLHRDGGQAQYIDHGHTRTADPGLGPLLHWIEENAHRPLSLDDVAARAGLSVRTLNRRFHAHTGGTPMQWLAGVRIRRARELLETTGHGVDRIAYQVGFPSPTNFRAQFKRLTGVTPQAYRTTFRPASTGPRA
ncbi:GlxA family transcriptional regulator [Spirilliplanes yamanashiensis]|uniref:AraC family transcriptional regulator n=1 Tax=Spirilliplanes yamanashiensis TaxID=42233 RepID=A0A8J3Y6N4_9ACTN|nr:helix-turn-helix domain-containing protein [Spirilliplanes yamanashiensis]MDP9814674.1 transcriptional regulator GlxA family with amidase domain [Spirilliplanes yamanashiensis]GIJ02327.1 AraC family transcriptional regulator [Spirilliplanes yamanashiensis]